MVVLVCGRNQCQEGGSDPGNALLKQNTSTLPTTSKHSVILIEKSEKCLQEIVFSEQKITWKYLDIGGHWGQVFSSFLNTCPGNGTY